MASFGIQLSFFLLLVLVLSPQIQAREGKFSFFTHFRTIYNVNPQVLLKKARVETPAPAPAPTPIVAPITAPTPAPAAAPEQGSIIASGPAPEPEFVDSGEGYGLYGTDSSRYSETKETPTTTYTNFENELLNEDFTGKKYKTGYPKTNLYNNYNNEVYRNNYNGEEYKSNYNNEEYRSNYNNEEFRTKYNNGYNKNHVDSYSNNYNGNGYYNNYNYKGNGYKGKREGMSDTRFLENGKYYYHVNTDNENYKYNLNNGYESERGSTENEGYYEKSQYPNEFDTMEEYEKQLESQGYTP